MRWSTGVARARWLHKSDPGRQSFLRGVSPDSKFKYLNLSRYRGKIDFREKYEGESKLKSVKRRKTEAQEESNINQSETFYAPEDIIYLDEGGRDDKDAVRAGN